MKNVQKPFVIATESIETGEKNCSKLKNLIWKFKIFRHLCVLASFTAHIITPFSVLI